MTEHGDLLHKAYAAFNRRDINGVLVFLHPQVQWANGWEGGFVTGYDDVRHYWTRQWQEIDPHVEPVEISPLPDGRQQVRVHQVVKDRTGALLFDGFVNHIYTFENGQVTKMEIAQ